MIGLCEYLVISALFFLHALLALETAHMDLKECRIRESKVLARMKIKRLKKNVLLSIVWPVRVVLSLYVCLTQLRKS